jgi:hypothetical protein
MTRLQITEDEVKQLIDLIEFSINKEKSRFFQEIVTPHSFDINTMELLLIRLKSL